MIEILICTINGRINQIASNLPPFEPDVCYLVSWQHTGAEEHTQIVPQALQQRHDLRVINPEGRGISANRNAALRAARGDILVIADDDCRFSPENIENIRRAYTLNPQADIILFRLTDYNGQLLHNAYSSGPYQYPELPRGVHFCSCEITLRRRSDIPPFSPHFGIGATYLKSGEEQEWIHRFYRQLHAKIIFVPLNLAATNPATTGTRLLYDPAIQRANGAIHRLLHGMRKSLPRFLKYALTADLPFTKRAAYFCHLLQGALYVGKISKQ